MHHATPAHEAAPMFTQVHSALDHALLKTLGALWAVANVVHFGWDLVSALGPILIGIGGIWAAWNRQQERLERKRAGLPPIAGDRP